MWGRANSIFAARNRNCYKMQQFCSSFYRYASIKHIHDYFINPNPLGNKARWKFFYCLQTILRGLGLGIHLCCRNAHMLQKIRILTDQYFWDGKLTERHFALSALEAVWRPQHVGAKLPQHAPYTLSKVISTEGAEVANLENKTVKCLCSDSPSYPWLFH